MPSLRDTFSDCHPAVNFLYFALVLAFSMTLMHPACLLISLTGACCYVARLCGLRELGRSVRWLVPMALLAALVNPAFVHQGVTILTYLPTGNPLTLESILYGFAAALLLASVVLWFRCFSTVMTSDKFIYLFGRVIPALSLVLSMTLRFVPRFRRQFRAVSQAQRYMGRDTSSGGLLQRGKNAMKVFSVLVTWSLESAIDTADSMRSRGYGQPGRTAFSIYRLDDRDRSLLLWLGFCGLYLLTGVVSRGLYFQYYPLLLGAPAQPLTVSFFAVYLLLCLTPSAMSWASRRRFRRCMKGGA